jgi:hypothetical protein
VLSHSAVGLDAMSEGEKIIEAIAVAEETW